MADEIDDWVVARYKPNTGAFDVFDILWFRKRLDETTAFELPVDMAV